MAHFVCRLVNTPSYRGSTILSSASLGRYSVRSREVLDRSGNCGFFSTREDMSKMTNNDLADSSTIPGWELIHCPPKQIPRGALVGTVISVKMHKTLNVAVDRYRVVAKVRKRLKYTKKFMAHDENEVANAGDLVMIVPCQRISKHKHFMLHEIVRAREQL